MAQSKDIQARRKDIEMRLEAGESIIQAMFTTVTAEWIMFQAVVTALLDQGVLTEIVVDRMLVDAQQRLQQDDHPALSPSMIDDIASRLDCVRDELHRVVSLLGTDTPRKFDYGQRGGKTDAMHQIRGRAR